jgi:hypothetical protein
METILALFPSLNQVSLIRRNLHRAGIYLEMTRAPQCLAATGCSFALRCTAADLAIILQVGRSAGIADPALFRETMRGGKRVYEEIAS